MAAEQSSHQPAAEQPAISPALRNRLQRCFDRGQELSSQDKPDFDYAHTMFSECVSSDPSNLVYVEALLDNLQAKYGNNKKGARIKGFGGKKRFKRSVANEEWDHVFRLGLEILKNNPWDVPTLRALADVCQANRYNEVELRYLKNALDANPKDIEVNRHCAKSLARMGQFDQAIACWHRIEELNKNDEEARPMITQLSIAKQRGFTSFGDDDSPSSVAANQTSSPNPSKQAADAAADDRDHRDSDEPGQATIQLLPRQKLEKAIRDAPQEVDNYVELAKIYSQEKKYSAAVEVLTSAVSASGSDPKVQEMLEDVQMERGLQQILIAERQAANENSQAAHDLVKQLREQQNRKEIDVYYGRSARAPTDLKLQYHLGIRLKRAGNYSEAIKCLQAARDEPSYRVSATLEMGECFQQIKQYNNALKCYQSASDGEEVTSFHQKMALYRAGVLAAAFKEIEVAEKSFQKLVDADGDFKDACDRLDKIKQISHKG